MYQIEVRHDGLHKYRVIRDRDQDLCERKAEAQVAAWEEMWAKRMEKQELAQQRAKAAASKEAKKQEAEQRTNEATERLAELGRLLVHTLSVDDAVDWESLKNNAPFPEEAPTPPVRPDAPSPPALSDPEYKPRLSLIDKLLPSRRRAKLEECQRAFDQAEREWGKAKKELELQHDQALQQHAQAMEAWQARSAKYYEKQERSNTEIDRRRREYGKIAEDAIIDYCELVLSRSEYPDSFPQEFDLEYKPDAKLLIVDYSLPRLDDLPKVKQVRYIQSRDEFRETELSSGELNRTYDHVLYQICLRTVHELLEADVVGALDIVVFNGWVNAIDPATGKTANSCVLSMQTNRNEFLEINLESVAPKACFKSLKGIGSSKLHSITPVAPIVQINRDDKRFVSSYEVAGALDDRTNLAAMDWEDFEHLIREIFEKEFSVSGGEVKVTRASRDGGVDAIAFDPDPIRGGKIVIQAKRYTNTVGVSAVRDLYGTLMNEGATKGILVTTADYGPDAYEFAKGKPLALLNGGNLLSLLDKHGHKAMIDVKAARTIVAERDK